MTNKNRLILGAVLGFLLAGNAYSLTILSKSSDGRRSVIEYSKTIPTSPHYSMRVVIAACTITAQKGKSGTLIFELDKADPDALQIVLTPAPNFKWTYNPSNIVQLNRASGLTKVSITAIVPTEPGYCSNSPMTGIVSEK